MMGWSESYEKVKKSVFKIETPQGGQGTGFLLLLDEDADDWKWAFVTAYHVVEGFDRWGGAIELTRHTSLLSHVIM